jgi:integrase
MAAPKQYRVRTRRNADGSTTLYARFTDQHGIRQEFPLGRTPEWNLDLAEAEMRHIRTDVERGTWSPRYEHTSDPQRLLFGPMAIEWWEAKVAGQMAERTQDAYKAVLDGHLMPHFEKMAVAAITKYEVDRFVQRGLTKTPKPLSPAYINSQVRLLAQILDLAMDWYEGILPANPARGRGRRVPDKKTHEPDRWLDAAQIQLLLDAARELDQSAKREDYKRLGRESIIACLCFSGLRNTELCELTWNDIDFHRRIIQPPGTKTEAAARRINIVDGLLPRLLAHRDQTPYAQRTAPVWPSANGRHRDKDNLNRRIIQPVVAKARSLVAADEEHAKTTGAARKLDVVLPSRITAHTFRRTFCGFAAEATMNPFYVRNQMGHTDARFTLRVYSQVENSGEPDGRVVQWMRRPQMSEAA